MAGHSARGKDDFQSSSGFMHIAVNSTRWQWVGPRGKLLIVESGRVMIFNRDLFSTADPCVFRLPSLAPTPSTVSESFQRAPTPSTVSIMGCGGKEGDEKSSFPLTGFPSVREKRCRILPSIFSERFLFFLMGTIG